ncbi:hypothetical protein PIB30_057156 [Stylosanthes scabra]|uniref:Uncharacterized protein n=1 Tax=Stylosanthes scabra TaxID=79078 RepID=A0ABU6XIM2_9FABA|nr:hypothetical protein [Stylosanthes scabra]
MGINVLFFEYPTYGRYVNPVTGGAVFWRPISFFALPSERGRARVRIPYICLKCPSILFDLIKHQSRCPQHHHHPPEVFELSSDDSS